MKAVISIVGRANVGKSTLYNRLTRSRDAIVDDFAGVTRDRLVGEGRVDETSFWVIDTGGYDQQDESGLRASMRRQFEIAVEESSTIILVVDGRTGLCAGDQEIAEELRSCVVPVYVAVNKTEGMEPDLALAEFHRLGIGKGIFAISAKQGGGVRSLITTILQEVVTVVPSAHTEADDAPRVAIVGKPNVGKSTLTNRLLGEDRMVVSDSAGTTRDSVHSALAIDAQRYTLIDTAGIRRKSRVIQKLEKISVVKTLRTLEQAHVIIFVVDARDGITSQDATLAGMVREYGRSMVLVVNKWDGLQQHTRDNVRRSIRRTFPFLDAVPVLFVSAKHGSGVGQIMPAVKRAYESAMISLSTAKLNVVLRRAVEEQPPPRVGSQQVKLKYAHQGGKNPPKVVIHGNLLHKVPESYKRYLARSISQGFKLTGTRIDLLFRTSKNPYARSRSPAH